MLWKFLRRFTWGMFRFNSYSSCGAKLSYLERKGGCMVCGCVFFCCNHWTVEMGNRYFALTGLPYTLLRLATTTPQVMNVMQPFKMVIGLFISFIYISTMCTGRFRL